MDGIEIRASQDPQPMCDFARQAGWNQTIDECRLLVEAPGAITLYAMKDAEIVGSAAAQLYGGNRMGFVNMVFVLPEMRGHGIATALLKAVMGARPDVATWRLYATEAGSKVYEKLGYRQAFAMAKYFAAPELVRSWPREGAEVMTAADIPAAVACDTAAFGFNRPWVIDFLYRAQPSLAFKRSHAGRLTGFSLGRVGANARHVAINAASLADACALLRRSAAEEQAGRPVQVMAYEIQKDFTAFLLDNGFKATVPMYVMDFGAECPQPAVNYYGTLGGEFA
ncbi:MAG: GNAT family N-acetyltransferase [Lentisphaerae bacterium]|jgi:GNAT superfamily N-acetyltransferase|nr:GNAT family N-acetyltransferase [Lentisphaerota bacterium]